MFEGRTLRSISLQALLIATIIQGMTADARDLASPFLLQRLVPDPAAGPRDARGAQLPTDDGAGRSRDRDDEGDADEICVPGELGAATAWRRHLPGSSRSRSLSSRPSGWFVQPTPLLPAWSLGAAPRDRDPTLSLCRLTC
jgi:hypothetical protein